MIFVANVMLLLFCLHIFSLSLAFSFSHFYSFTRLDIVCVYCNSQSRSRMLLAMSLYLSNRICILLVLQTTRSNECEKSEIFRTLKRDSDSVIFTPTQSIRSRRSMYSLEMVIQSFMAHLTSTIRFKRRIPQKNEYFALA